MHDGTVVSLQAFMSATIPPRVRSFRQWLSEEIIIPSGPFAGQRLNFDRQPYVRLWADAVDSGLYRNHVVTGCVQSGKSLNCFIAVILYYLFELRENVIVGMPIGDMIETKWTKDIRPVIAASDLRRHLPLTGPGSQGGTPKEITFLNGANLQFMVGGGSDKTRAGATSRTLIVTETDGLDQVGGGSNEGTKISQLEGRTKAFAERARHFFECTVSTDKGYTWREYQAGTASRIVCPCPHCDAGVSPERDDLIGWQDAQTESEAGRKAAFACSSCGGLWTESQRREMNRLGILVHRGQEYIDGQIVGNAPDTYTLGFRWNAFNNLFWSTAYIGEGEWKAAQGSQNGEESTENTTRLQYVWAMPITGETVEKVPLTRGIVRGSATGYAGRCNGLPMGVVPVGTGKLTCMIDVHKRMLRWMIVAHLESSKHVVGYGEHPTDRPDVVGEDQAVFDALVELVPIIMASADIDVGMIDAGYQPDAVYRAVKIMDGPWVASHGASKFVMPTVTTRTKVRNRHDEHWYYSRPESGRKAVQMDSDYFKHLVHSSLMIRPLTDEGEPAPGAITLYGEDPREHDNFAAEVLAETWVRTFESRKGRVGKVWRSEWVKTSKQNHCLDLLYGNLCAESVADSLRPSTSGKKWSEVAAEKRRSAK